jgi:branched-chain amino acid transport system substrate-binding protein
MPGKGFSVRRYSLVLTFLVSLCALLLLGVGCRSASSGGPAMTGQQVTVVNVGAVLSLTRGAAAFGAAQRNGIELAQEEINATNYIPGYRLNVVVEDDASEKMSAINAFRRLISEERVCAIVGPTLSSTAFATDQIAQEAGVPVLAVSNTASGIADIGDYIFRDSLTEAQIIPSVVKRALDKYKFKRAAILYANDDAFTKATYDLFKQAIDENRVEIVATETFARGSRSFSTQLTNIRGKNPDVVVIAALPLDAASILVQARQIGLNQPVIGGTSLTSPSLIQHAGQAAEGVIVGVGWNVGVPNEKSQRFVQKYREKYGSEPDQYAAQAYAGMYILAQAIKTAPSTERSAVRDALAAIKNFDTVLGTFSFLPNGDADYQAAVTMVKDGKFVLFE